MRIEKEFEELLPPLTDEEFRQLEENILEDGIRDPLVVWKTPSGNEVLVDGHNRLKIAQKHNLKYETVYMTFDDFDDVKLWIYRNQKGRREMNPVQHIEVLEKLKPALVKEAKRNSLANLKNSESQNSDARGRTDEKIGKMAGVSRDTVRKVEHILDKGSEETKAAARSGQISVNEAYKRTVKENEPPKPDIPTVEEEHEEEVHEAIAEARKNDDIISRSAVLRKIEEKKKPHVVNNSGDNEWYTPAEYIEAARAVMGTIDLDPASNDFANETVKAETYYTEETNGLLHEWTGNIWMNPPYSGGAISQFVKKLVESDFAQSIVLVNNATDTEWFRMLTSKAKAIVFTTGRIRFVKRDGAKNTPLQGQAFVYFGKNRLKFVEVFSRFGWGCFL